MAIGIDADTEYARRSSIPSGGAGTLSDGGFTNYFTGVWVRRPSSTATYALSAGGSFIHLQAGAREVVLGFDSAGAVLADLTLQVVFNSGGGTGTPYSFTGYTGASFLDEWVYMFTFDNATDTQVAGYIPYSTMTPVYQARTNDNAGSQYINTLTFGNNSSGNACVLGHYAYARARYGGGVTLANIVSIAQLATFDSNDWGGWPLSNNADNVDDSGNGRDLTFNGTLTSESDPSIGGPTYLGPPTLRATITRRVGT